MQPDTARMPDPESRSSGDSWMTRQLDAALAGLDGLDQLEPAEHVARFDAVHSALTEALSSIDKV